MVSNVYFRTVKSVESYFTSFINYAEKFTQKVDSAGPPEVKRVCHEGNGLNIKTVEETTLKESHLWKVNLGVPKSRVRKRIRYGIRGERGRPLHHQTDSVKDINSPFAPLSLMKEVNKPIFCRRLPELIALFFSFGPRIVEFAVFGRVLG
ncbi:hypothetical protein CEXT_285571 [Caerostris extrusa]|uniref:Uncharacterized protein n=1 Tax=Caerostris extrusa TaxID=172846 RepID=A0AAV4Y0K7_CAEEX|nr:hypothetical protein CEXT_285571 [Caerostris extrusa]